MLDVLRFRLEAGVWVYEQAGPSGEDIARFKESFNLYALEGLPPPDVRAKQEAAKRNHYPTQLLRLDPSLRYRSELPQCGRAPGHTVAKPDIATNVNAAL
jgi:hypothetical protein